MSGEFNSPENLVARQKIERDVLGVISYLYFVSPDGFISGFNEARQCVEAASEVNSASFDVRSAATALGELVRKASGIARETLGAEL